ncbi:DUF2231 domain-containing protein [Caulobacter sp.]|uniref:DUF2231 domain-containing protein n=1 Tax=Caulobacter sp. TaxID=78 RepID=UPI001AFD0CDA|nr:DUF2231 domain-containing protein [Caulobacter sp.]MBO9544631.1 hypothetical protein [Caulobacter sp.]
MPASRGIGATPLHPVHSILLAFPLALFPAGLASDIAYLNSAAVQWTNFSAWLIAGGCFFGGLTLAWAIVALAFPGRTTRGRALVYLAAVAVMFIAGLINAFQHSHDGWSSVGAAGLVLSIISSVAALIAAAIGYSSQRAEGLIR